jgi:signal transduction histidine kinase
VTAWHELSPRQLRALLLLLVLLPLSPTVLMFRYVVEAVRDEHAEAEDQFADVYRQALAAANGSLRNHFATGGQPKKATPESLFQYYRRALDLAVRIRIVGADGRTLVGDAPDSAKMIGEDSIGNLLPGARVRIYPAARSARAIVDEQINYFGWAVAAVAVGNILVSGAAAIALHRQSRLRELQSSALAMVAHELKTPLASMRVLTDTLLGMPGETSAQYHTYLQLIATENDRLIRLTENFLTLTRFEKENGLEHGFPVEPAILARTALESLESRFNETGIRPQVEIEDDLPDVTVNQQAMVVVLVNLLDNALKYSERGNPVAMRVRRDNGAVQFVVEDKGIGIPAEAQARIFNCFYQVDQKLARTREGCGLGLHIARSIVEAHGGTIAVQSAPGNGSTFTVNLPATSRR